MNEQQQKYTELQAHKIESIKGKYKTNKNEVVVTELPQRYLLIQIVSSLLEIGPSWRICPAGRNQ